MAEVVGICRDEAVLAWLAACEEADALMRQLGLPPDHERPDLEARLDAALEAAVRGPRGTA